MRKDLVSMVEDYVCRIKGGTGVKGDSLIHLDRQTYRDGSKTAIYQIMDVVDEKQIREIQWGEITANKYQDGDVLEVKIPEKFGYVYLYYQVSEDRFIPFLLRGKQSGMLPFLNDSSTISPSAKSATTETTREKHALPASFKQEPAMSVKQEKTTTSTRKKFSVPIEKPILFQVICKNCGRSHYAIGAKSGSNSSITKLGCVFCRHKIKVNGLHLEYSEDIYGSLGWFSEVEIETFEVPEQKEILFKVLCLNCNSPLYAIEDTDKLGKKKEYSITKLMCISCKKIVEVKEFAIRYSESIRKSLGWRELKDMDLIFGQDGYDEGVKRKCHRAADEMYFSHYRGRRKSWS